MTAIRKHFKDFIAVIGLILIAAGVSAYILSNQRMRFPIIQDKPYVLKAEFQTAQAVIAGQGQTVRVAGVRIGDIGAVELKDGRAIVRMDIDRKYEDMVHTDATALLRPKTGLKDMFIQLDPGTDGAPVAKENWTIPVDSTQPDVNPDEILSSLDADTRDYLRLLISDVGRGLKGRNGDLRDLFRRFEPTHKDLAAVNGAIAERRTNLRRLITSLNELNGELASHDDDVAGLVTASSAVLRSFASEEQNISAAVAELPSTLRQTTSSLGPGAALRRRARPGDRAPAARRPRAGPGQPGRRAVREGGHAAAGQGHPAVRQGGAPARPRPAARLGAARRRRARPDAHVQAVQQLLQPARLQPERPRGPGERRAPGGLPVLAGVGAAPGDPALLDLRRQRRVPPGDDRARRAPRSSRRSRTSPRSSSCRCSRRCSPTPRPAPRSR